MRGSDQHGPRVDEQLAHEEQGMVQGHSDEGRTEARRMEAPGPGDEAGFGQRTVVDDGIDHGPSPQEVAARAELAALFERKRFPASRDELVEAAEAAAADDQLIDQLRRLPPDARYENPGDVWAAFTAGSEQQE